MHNTSHSSCGIAASWYWWTVTNASNADMSKLARDRVCADSSVLQKKSWTGNHFLPLRTAVTHDRPPHAICMIMFTSHSWNDFSDLHQSLLFKCYHHHIQTKEKKEKNHRRLPFLCFTIVRFDLLVFAQKRVSVLQKIHMYFLDK